MDKIYSAFISSTAKVSEYRKDAVDALLDLDFYCHCMEHFTAHDFNQIKNYIKNSDFVLVIMGTDYGTVDTKTGKSWTQLEFEYAREIGKPVLVIKTPELEAAISEGKGVDKLQKKFYKLISEDYDLYSRSIDNKLTIGTVLSQYTTRSIASFSGWSRNEISGAELEKWAAQNAAYNLNGTWYHYHHSESDRSYIRMGQIEVEQDFTPSGYKKCKFVGQNDGVEKDEDEKIIVDSNGVPEIDKDHNSNWVGEYTLQDHTYTGIYKTTRSYSKSNFAGQKENNQDTRGIHDFNLVVNNRSDALDFFQGMFHDIAPSVKQGKISVFRSREERDKSVAKYLKRYKQISE